MTDEKAGKRRVEVIYILKKQRTFLGWARGITWRVTRYKNTLLVFGIYSVCYKIFPIAHASKKKPKNKSTRQVHLLLFYSPVRLPWLCIPLLPAFSPLFIELLSSGGRGGRKNNESKLSPFWTEIFCLGKGYGLFFDKLMRKKGRHLLNEGALDVLLTLSYGVDIF